MSIETPPEPRYKVQSLERGLSILRELRNANGPVRNRELVDRTGLPKATVSRLLSTLGELNYVRRTDQGSYVLARGSARSGRAMLGALGLDQYRKLFAEAPGPVYLQVIAGGRLVPVYLWSRTGAGAVTSSSPAMLVSVGRDSDRDHGDCWDADTGTWRSWISMNYASVGSFLLTVQVKATLPPSVGDLSAARQMLERAAKAMALGREQ